jgi:hypothetical protein
MKKYGLILSSTAIEDSWRGFWFNGVKSAGWDRVDLLELINITGTDFEAVDVSSMMIDENSGQARFQ